MNEATRDISTFSGELDPNRDTIPVFDSERGFRVWLINEIYTGPKGKGRYVPNIDDMVVDYENGFWRIIEVDDIGISKKIPWNIPISQNSSGEKDKVLGAGPGLFQSEAQRLYVNKAVTPYTMVPDIRMHFYSVKLKYVKYFRGYDTGINGEVIGIHYTANGLDANENIPTELIVTPDRDNYGIRRPLEAYTTAELRDGEPVTIVAYDSGNNPVCREVLLVSDTTFVRPVEQGQRYITHIELVSPWISPTDKSVLSIPSNMAVEALGLMCRVHYNDSFRTVAIDGSKVRLEGFEQYVPTVDNEEVPLALIYNLSKEEASITGKETDRKFISRPYWAVSRGAEDAYNVKLFPIPTWVDEFTGWFIEWYLYNLERKQVYYVTPWVEWNANSPPFYPLKYGTMQYLGVSLELSKVDQRFIKHRHTQNLGITLMANGVDNTLPWLIEFFKGADKLYGKHKEALITFNSIKDWDLDITCGCETLDEWLDEVYYGVHPLFVEGAEMRAPKPTHFVLILADIRMEFPVENWNKTLKIATGLHQGAGLPVQWIHRLPEDDLQLGVSPLVVRHTTTSKTS